MWKWADFWVLHCTGSEEASGHLGCWWNEWKSAGLCVIILECGPGIGQTLKPLPSIHTSLATTGKSMWMLSEKVLWFSPVAAMLLKVQHVVGFSVAAAKSHSHCTTTFSSHPPPFLPVRFICPFKSIQSPIIFHSKHQFLVKNSPRPAPHAHRHTNVSNISELTQSFASQKSTH